MLREARMLSAMTSLSALANLLGDDARIIVKEWERGYYWSAYRQYDELRSRAKGLPKAIREATAAMKAMREALREETNRE